MALDPRAWPRAQVRRAVAQLRDGVPPAPEVADWLTVGQKRLIEQLEDALMEAEGGGTVLRFLRGDPGLGKSHFLGVLRHRAAIRRTLLSYSSQDMSAGVMLNHPQSVYRQIMSNLEAGPTHARDVLTEVLGVWAAHAAPLVVNARPTLAMLRPLSHAGLLPPYEEIPRRSRLCLAGYLLAWIRREPEMAEPMLRALRGLDISNGDLCRVGADIGLERWSVGFTPSKYQDDFWFTQMGLLAYVARMAGRPATAVLLDELESLIGLSRSTSRDKAYRVLNGLFQRQYPLAGVLLVFAYTPDFLERVHRDFDAYGHEFRKSWWGVVDANSFEVAELDERGAMELAGRIASLHGLAEDWDASGAMRSGCRELIKAWRTNNRSTRYLVRGAVSLLDRASQ